MEFAGWDSATDGALTHGHLLDGRVAYAQPARGYRSGIEPVLLASAVPARPGEHVLEAGCGAGAAMLCLAARVPGLGGIALERAPELALLAAANLAANGHAAITAMAGDITAGDAPGPFDHVFANPPWHDSAASASPDPRRDRARRLVTGLEAAWVGGLTARLRSRGTLTLVLPAAGLQAWLSALRPAGCGSVLLMPLWPRPGVAARLLLLRAVRDGRGPSRVHPGLVLHLADGKFTPAAEGVLRHGEAFDADANSA
jgi:tRNA1(Val) A37 N6-methylase TrmN6